MIKGILQLLTYFSTDVIYMEISRAINSDKRYYLDEKTIENAASFLETMRVFNDAKMDLYNALYDQKYLASGPLIDHAYPVFLKEKYKTNDYYNAAIYLAASGSISSQKELKKYYITTITADLKTRDEKIQTIQEALDKKKAVKNSIRIYRKDGRWVTPYPRCQLKVKGLTIVLFNKTIVKLDEYERSVEADIRKLKTRLALVTEARKRKEKKLENIKNLKLICMDAIEIDEVFNKEIDTLYLNFSDPWPKKRHAKRRLTSEIFLKKYDLIFENKNNIIMKTDNQALFEYSVMSLNNYGYKISYISLDLHSTNEFNIETEYERKFSSKGFRIYKIEVYK